MSQPNQNPDPTSSSDPMAGNYGSSYGQNPYAGSEYGGYGNTQYDYGSGQQYYGAAPGGYGAASGGYGAAPGEYGYQPATTGDTAPAVLSHLSVFIALVLSAGWLMFLGPLIMWAIFKDTNPLARNAAAGAFNFALSMTIATVVGWILFFTIIGIPIAILLWLAVLIAMVVCHIKGAMAASRGENYDYPFQLRVLN